MATISLYSSLVYLFILLSPLTSFIPYGKLLGETGNHALFYNFQHSLGEKTEAFLRNPGPFWEPGAFGAYLIIALFFLLFTNNSISKKLFLRYLMILVFGVLTTLSTTIYITFAFLILLYFLIKNLTSIKRVFRVISIILPVFIFIFYKAFEFIPFLKDKIIGQFESSLIQDKEYWFSTRFGNFIFNIDYILAHPFFGNGPSIETRFHLHPWMKNLDFPGFGNGFTEIIVIYGFLGFVIIFKYLYTNFKKYYNSSQKAWSFLIIISLLLQGEQLQNYPFFFALIFINEYKSPSPKKRLIIS